MLPCCSSVVAFALFLSLLVPSNSFHPYGSTWFPYPTNDEFSVDKTECARCQAIQEKSDAVWVRLIHEGVIHGFCVSWISQLFGSTEYLLHSEDSASSPVRCG